MTMVQTLAWFVEQARFEQLSADAVLALKIRILDALGCAFGALKVPPAQALRAYLNEVGGRPLCTLIGGGRSAPDRAAFYNGALIRYLDFNDAYLARGETCHPSDSLGAVLAAAEHAGRHGRDLLTALAMAYGVQCRLSAVAPVRARGFDHTVQGVYGAAAGVAKALGLDADRTAHALAIAGTAFNALRVTRTGALSHWKGLAAPNAAFGATHAALLARHGITGPAEVFEGKKGFMEAIAGRFALEWSGADLSAVSRTILKKFNAEIHAQSALEAILELRAERPAPAEEIERIEIDIFDVAFHIIGGGEEGDKTRVTTKEEADHSLPYLAAVAWIDGQVMPEQYAPARIAARDVQSLLRRVKVAEDPEMSRRFPEEMPCQVRVHFRDGQHLARAKRDYEGFHTRPLSFGAAVEKFDRLSQEALEPAQQRAIAEAVGQLEALGVREFTSLLARARKGGH
jgi:2-methylcitrate dehydratase